MLCGFCGSFMQKVIGFSHSRNKQVKVVFQIDNKPSICDHCREDFFYSYDDLAQAYTVSSLLMKGRGIPERVKLGKYVEFQSDLVNHICKEQRYKNTDKIVEFYREDFHRLRDLTSTVFQIIERYDVYNVMRSCKKNPSTVNPSLKLKEFMQGKIKRKLKHLRKSY